jgi:hypothetical protein
MERTFTLTVSIIVLMATLAAANAATTARSHRPVTPVSDQALLLRNAFDWASPMPAAEPRTRRYHGGPKSND